MTLAEATREAVRRNPFLYEALRAGVVNYSAAARFLDVEADTDTGRASTSEPSVTDAPEDVVEHGSTSPRSRTHDDGAGTDSGVPAVADASEDAVVAALRRMAEDLPAYERPRGGPPVSMRSGLGDGDPAEALVVVGEMALVPDAGSLTAVIASGIGDPTALRHVLGCLDAHEIPTEAAAVGGEALVIVTDRRHGPDALRVVEDALGDR